MFREVRLIVLWESGGIFLSGYVNTASC